MGLAPKVSQPMPRTAAVPLLAILCLALFGCALPPNSKPDPRDPFERVNRATFRFNDALDRAVARPVVLTYQRVVPRPVREGVSNFLDNLYYPITIVNDLLQFKFKPFALDSVRFVTNSTIGLGGVFDPATQAGLQKNDEDLGQTFGHWGAHAGPYIMIPFLGPSDVRDGVGRIGDIWLSPPHYIQNNYVSYSIWGLGVLDARYRLLPADQALDQAYDRYSFLKNAYLQRRQFLVTDGQLSESERRKQEQQQYDEEKRIIEESEGGDQPDSGAPSPQPPPK